MTLDADLMLDGEPEAEFVPGIAATFPRKRISSAALIRDPLGRVMLLDQPYRPTWGLPGGMLDENEPPLAGLHREIREEFGVELPVGPLLAVDWIPRHGAWTDSLQFLFDGGVLTDDDVAGFTVQASEITAVHFVPVDSIGEHVRPSLGRRLVAGLEAQAAGTTSLLEFGRPR